MSLLGRKPVLSQADLLACRTLLKGGSKSFHAASRLLPRSVCEPAAALYAFCRVADDAIDLDGSLGALALLHERLDRIYAGRPMDMPADRALAAVVDAYGIPRALPAALLDGFAWDREGRRYETIEALEDYAARVAGAAGPGCRASRRGRWRRRRRGRRHREPRPVRRRGAAAGGRRRGSFWSRP
jgi:phytoene synthase